MTPDPRYQQHILHRLTHSWFFFWYGENTRRKLLSGKLFHWLNVKLDVYPISCRINTEAHPHPFFFFFMSKIFGRSDPCPRRKFPGPRLSYLNYCVLITSTAPIFQLIILSMHLYPRMNDMLEFICMGSVDLPPMKNYYSKLNFTTENFTTWKVFFSTKLEPIKIPFSIQKLTIFFILIFIYVLDYK